MEFQSYKSQEKQVILTTQSILFILGSHKNHLDQNAQPVHYSEITITYLDIKFEIEIQEKHTT